MEYTVNVNIENIPRALSVTTFEIPDKEILIINEKQLPGNWRSVPIPSSTQDFGTRLLKISSNKIIKIPSSVIAEEFNYILNPIYSSNFFKIVEIKDLIYDVRIKTV